MLTDLPKTKVLTISVCILTSNRDQLLAPLLRELVRQIKPGDEVLVLDTGGNDSTRQVIAGVSSSQVIYHPFPMAKFDFATARNQLLKLASRDGMVFIDDDAFPFSDWLNRVKANLQELEAAGGVTVADGAMPDWWDPEINWCVGLSPPGTALGMPGYYPDTCNLSGHYETWKYNPFTTVLRSNRHLYATGREDAEWWTERRLEGRNIDTSYQQAVSHFIHPGRVKWKYVKQRAFNDGISSWLRRPHYDAATAIPWDLAHIIGVVFDKFILRPFDKRYRLADEVWMHRQWGKFVSVWKSPITDRSRRREQIYQLGKAALFQLRIRAGSIAFRGIKLLHTRSSFPPTNPKIIFISADCHVGDSILLRRHIQSVAITFPNAKVLLSSRHTVLMTGLAENVSVLPTEEMATKIRQENLPIDAAIVPYFPFGDHSLWRNRLSKVGATFDCDVTFDGRRDYILARHSVSKNLELHEQENLSRLFRLWPLRQVDRIAPPVVQAADVEWRNSVLRDNKVRGDYILIQFGAGHDYKEWPLDCWISFLHIFCPKVDLPILITGGENWKDAADIARKEVSHDPGIYNLIPGTGVGHVMALVQGASFFIGGCSGPKHLAMAYGVPSFTLYAATEPERWGATYEHHLHGYAVALKQKLTGMELQGLDKHHRVKLLDPVTVANNALAHYNNVRRRR